MSYKIGCLRYNQTELTWGQDKRLWKLILALAPKADPEEDLSQQNWPALVAKYDLLGEFWGIILQPANWFWRVVWLFSRLTVIPGMLRSRKSLRWINCNRLPHSQLERMWQDFFLQNKRFINLLQSIGDSFSLIATTALKDAVQSKTTPSGSPASTPKPPSSKKKSKRSNTTPAAGTSH